MQTTHVDGRLADMLGGTTDAVSHEISLGVEGTDTGQGSESSDVVDKQDTMRMRLVAVLKAAGVNGRSQQVLFSKMKEAVAAGW